MITIEPALQSDKQLIEALMQLYLHDLSEFGEVHPDSNGVFELDVYFDAYWQEPSRYPFKIQVQDQVAGFALIREIEPAVHSVAEFFVVHESRNSGVGKRAAHMIFDRFPGQWRVAEQEANMPAQAFWRSVIAEYTQGEFEERWSANQPRGPEQVFVSENRQ